MPTLHRYKDRQGFFVRGVSHGSPVAFQLTSEGEQYLTDTLGLSDGAKFAADTMKLLYKRKWALPMELPPEDVLSPVPHQGPPQPPQQEAVTPADHLMAPSADDVTNPVVYFGMVQLRLAGSDHVLLDQAVEDLVRELTQTKAIILGPLPLPVHIEPYVVWRETAGRKVYELRLYQRLLQVRNPRRQTMDTMTQLSLPREVDVKVEMLTPGA